jgi:hypothetical protein
MLKHARAHHRARLLLAGFTLAATSISALAQLTGTINGLAADAQVDKTGSNPATVSNTSTTYTYAGATASTNHCIVWVFQIPGAVLSDPTMRFTQASLAMKLGQTIHPASGVNGDLYGVGYSTSSAVTTADFYYGASDSGNMLIQDNVVTPATASYASLSVNNTSMVDYLNQCLDNARADSATTAYVFFRMSPDGHSYGNKYSFAMNEAGASVLPKLTYTAVQVPKWRTVPLGGGGYVTGLVSDATGNAVYCRTDVGGAYRWDAVKGEWKNLTDKIVPVSTPGAADLQSIFGIALDPTNANNVYIAAGKYTYSANKGIWASSDAGNTWTQINNTIVMHGNGPYRDIGERLAVDPNNPNVLWCGSIQGGLYKGVKSGSTWTWSQIPAASVPWGTVPSGQDKAGVVFVVCDKNGTNTITYAGVWDNVGSTGGVYQSTDGGTTWTKVGGTAFGRPQRATVAPNGTLYVSGYLNGVFKMPRGGTFTQCAGLPLGGPDWPAYRGISAAQDDPTGNTFYVAISGNKLYRSNNGGASFSAQGTNWNSGNKSRKEPDNTPTLTGYWFGNTSCLLTNPTNSNELWVGDFFGVARTQNAQDMGTTNGPMYYMLQKEQEETVVESLKSSPTGPRLMMGVADVGGFRYNDTTKRPYSTFGNTFWNPGGGSTIGLDFSEANNSVWARTWVNGPHDGGTGAYSVDGGANWRTFGTINAKNITNSGTITPETWDVTPYISRQKAKGNNIVTMAVAAGNSNTPLYSNHTIPFYSREDATAAYRPTLIVNGSTQLVATADTDVADAAPTTNYGTSTSISTGYNYANAPYSRRIYLKFDLSSVGTITSATLQLTRRTSGNIVQFPVQVYACPDTGWSETAITWNTRPGIPAGSGGDPIGDPRYYAGATSLLGGRIAVSSTDPNRIVWISQGMGKKPHYSDDAGATWTQCTTTAAGQMDTQFNPGIVINQLAADRVNGKFYFVQLGGTHHQVHVSTDGGATFSLAGSCNANAYNVYRAQIMAAPAADHVWISDDGVDDKTKGGIWKSTNGGVNWSKISGTRGTRQVTFGKAQAGSPHPYTVFINGFYNNVWGIFRSDDLGATWTKLEDAPTSNDIEAMSGDRQNYGKVWIGTHGRGTFEWQ